MDLQGIYTSFLRALNFAKVGGKTIVAPITGATIAVQAAAYGSGDVLGTGNPVELEVFTFENGTGVLQSISIGDLSKVDGIIDIVVFNDNPSSTTFTDNAALDIADTDIPKVIGVVPIVAADYSDFADNSVATVTAFGLLLKNMSATSGKKNKIWLAFVSKDTKTYDANAISANIGILQD